MSKFQVHTGAISFKGLSNNIWGGGHHCHSTTDHSINIQYYLWLALYLHNIVVLGIQEVYTELGFK